MNTTISAIYEQGVFHPLEPLELPEATLVQVHLPPDDHANAAMVTIRQYVARLRAALPRFAQQWSEKIVQQTYTNIFRDNVQTLWYLSPPLRRDLCAMVLLAIQNLGTEKLSASQVEALHFVLNKIEQEEVTEADIDASHEKLLEADLFLSFSLAQDALQSYLDES